MKKRIWKATMKIILIVIIIAVAILVAGFLFVNFYPSIGRLPDKETKARYASITSLFYDDRFHNENETSVMTDGQSLSGDRRTPSEMIKAEKPTYEEHGAPGELTFTWFGHSSSMLQLGDRNILIDPVLGKYSSPVTFTGVKRYSECPVSVDTLPPIDVLFISHDHYDHLDYATIKGIDNKVANYIVPIGVDVILESYGVSSDKITALYWWEDTTIDGINYTLTPSQHFSGRNPLKQNPTLWSGLFMRDDSHSVYYTGDGGYYDVFGQVYEKLGAPDLMLAEDGQYDPTWSSIHMMPEETVQAALDAHATWLIPVHWGTFVLANHSWDDPAVRATEAAKENGQNIATPRIGQTVNYDDISSFTERWWESIR